MWINDFHIQLVNPPFLRLSYCQIDTPSGPLLKKSSLVVVSYFPSLKLTFFFTLHTEDTDSLDRCR